MEREQEEGGSTTHTHKRERAGGSAAKDDKEGRIFCLLRLFIIAGKREREREEGRESFSALFHDRRKRDFDDSITIKNSRPLSLSLSLFSASLGTA